MMMSNNDKVETERQKKTEKRKIYQIETDMKMKKKLEEEEKLLAEREEFHSEVDMDMDIGEEKEQRGNSEFGDNSLRPWITPKLNLSATSLNKLITWKPGHVQEPSFTCSLSKAKIQGFKELPDSPPSFSCHT